MTSITRVARYEPGYRFAWDDFIGRSKNGTFLFYRDYMEYHADRFPDFSLLFFNADDTLAAVMPATAIGSTLSSHAGLTFGGIISDTRMKTPRMLEIFDALKAHLKGAGLVRLVYKAIPHVYHRLPAEEDLYALVRHNARLIRRDVSSTIDLKEELSFNKLRKRKIKQAQKHGLEVKQSTDYQSFMAIEEQVLSTKYDLKPVHTASELELLAGKFPDSIKLFMAYRGDEALAGVVIYESSTVAHAQYIAASKDGKETGALDLILNYLINDYYAAKNYFDFGISTENEGRHLNLGLIENKESFGARAIVYDFYQLDFDTD